MIEVKIINKSENPLPFYATEGAAGMDLYADISEEITLGSLERKLIPTGVFIELPEGYEAQIRPRSGMALKHGLTVINTPGTIDSDYRGEIGIVLVNLSKDDYTLKAGERIAQMVVSKHEKVKWETVKFLSKTTRNQGGYGSTGK